MFGVVSVPVPLSPRPAQQPLQHEVRSDQRLNTLRQFFGSTDCPAGEYAAAFLEVADQYELDWRLLPSIAFVETTGGKNSPHNNLFGWNSGRAHFRDPGAAIRSVGSRLAHSSLYRSKNLDEVLTTYNPTGDYARRVKSVMQRIASVQ
jgi:hypothetical protein